MGKSKKLMNFCQSNEEQLLSNIFDKIGFTNRVSVEFGGGDGYKFSNTRFFVENHEFEGHFWDCKAVEENGVKSEFITAENINDLFAKYKVPKKLDLLSIDIDGNDYWIWKALKWQPRVVIVEFNRSLSGSVSVPYDPNFMFERTSYFGASYEAFCNLAKKKGYYLVASNTINLIFCKEKGLPELEYKHEPQRSWWPKDNREFVNV